MTFDDAVRALPLVAILRGIRTEEAEAVVAALIAEGFRLTEVPLNSPTPLATIAALVERFAGAAVFGAGTVVTVAEAEAVLATGARLIVSPNTDPQVIRESRRLGMESWPGVFTATECFAAIAAGATGLKLFPADSAGIGTLSALRAVLPNDIAVFAVGGVGADNFKHWLAAGARGFGIGSALYRPGDSAETVGIRAREMVAPLRAINPSSPA